MEHYLKPINALLRVFCEEYHVTVTLYNKWGYCITHRGGGIALCRMIKAECGFSEECAKCDKKEMERACREKKSHAYVCHAGVTEAIKPLCGKTDGSVIGCVVIGKYHGEQIPDAHLELFEELIENVDASLQEKMRMAFRRLPHVNSDDILAALDVLADALLETCQLQSLYDEEIKQAIEFIEAKKGRATCKDLCELLHRSRHALADFFAKMCGETPSRFIAERNLMRTEDRLMNTTNSVAVISGDLGYDYLYFFEFFKKECGISPEKLRIRNSIGKGIPTDREGVSASDSLPF